MLTMRLNIFLIFLAISLITTVAAQGNYKEGYIITMDKDTIYGQIDLKSDMHNSILCRFLNKSTGELHNYKPYDIYGYRFINDGRYYVSRRIEMSKMEGEREVFLEYLLQGIKSLYYYTSKAGVCYYFIEDQGRMVKVDSPSVLINEKSTSYGGTIRRYIPILQYLYGDCHELTDKVQKARYTHQDMIYIAKEYHYAMCTTGEECIEFVTKSKSAMKMRVHVTPYAGMAFIDYRKSYFDVTSNPAVRYGVNFLFSGINPSGFGLAFDFSLIHSNLQIHNVRTEYNYYPLVHDKQTIIVPNLGLRYTHAFHQFSIFGEVGFGANITVKYNTLLDKKRKFHPYLSIGSQYYTTKKRKQAISLKCQYEYNLFCNTAFEYTSVGSILLGYTF